MNVSTMPTPFKVMSRSSFATVHVYDTICLPMNGWPKITAQPVFLLAYIRYMKRLLLQWCSVL